MIVRQEQNSLWGKLVLLALPLLILVGTCLLALPVSRNIPIDIIDLLFTSTSATCVCGLQTIGLSNFTLFGQSVIFALMQIGGLGIITLTIMFIFLLSNIKMSTRNIAGEILEIKKTKDVKKTLFFILILTIVCEAIGALVTFFNIKDFYPSGTAAFYSIFHATSAFCNAGLSLFPNGMLGFNNNFSMLFITMILIFIGGLGFVTWHEKFKFIKSLFTGKTFRVSLNSKLSLYIALTLISLGALLFWILEHNNSLAGASIFTSFTNSLFNSVAIRSAGLMTVSISSLKLATLLLIMCLSFVGSAPGSTGSGIKTTTFVIFLATVKAVISGRNEIEIRGRKIAKAQVYKAITILVLSISWIIFTTFCLLITEQNASFLNILFEASSAFSVSGLSLGLTSSLSLIGKLFIILSMLFGRIGSMTLVLVLLRQQDQKDFSYPEERVMLS